MKHARKDYNRIQDPENKIPEDEPVFLLRGQDVNAPLAVEFWADMAEKKGAKPDIIKAAREQALAMYEWQRKIKSKTPDMDTDDTITREGK